MNALDSRLRGNDGNSMGYRQNKFALRHASPRVIVSVLMLREGFDVNNISVIVHGKFVLTFSRHSRAGGNPVSSV